MDKQILKLSKKAEETLGNDSDYIIIAHKNGQCSGAFHGEAANIAQAIFALIHKDNGLLAKAIYRIIKLNAMNIMANPSPYALDLSEALSKVISETDE